jgi:hypothetical protein
MRGDGSYSVSGPHESLATTGGCRSLHRSMSQTPTDRTGLPAPGKRERTMAAASNPSPITIAVPDHELRDRRL